MEDFFFQDQSQSNISLPQNAFVDYTNRFMEEIPPENSIGRSNHLNMDKRMTELLNRPSPTLITEETSDPERERSYRHKMNERVRREKQKQSYSALHSLLPPQTKNNKRSIMEAAITEIQQLESMKVELERRNIELEANLEAKEMLLKIRLRVANPSSGIDSMLGVLKCLSNLGVKTKTVQSKFSAMEFSAVLEIESKIEAAEIEAAVQRTLAEVEWNFPYHFPEGSSS